MGHGPGMLGNWKGEGGVGSPSEIGGGCGGVGCRGVLTPLESDMWYMFEHIAVNTWETQSRADILGAREMVLIQKSPDAFQAGPGWLTVSGQVVVFFLASYLLRICRCQEKKKIWLRQKKQPKKTQLNKQTNTSFKSRICFKPWWKSWKVNTRQRVNTHRGLCSAGVYPWKPGRVLSVTWTFSLFAGTWTTLALMPDWDTLDYGIQHQVLAH